jgi:hypothetical protein
VQNNAVVAGGSKSFIINHPGGREDAEDRYLVHACLEGPENGVMYRGRATTDEDGWADVALPEYFEHLCAENGRQVFLQAVIDPESPMMHAVAASDVEDGAFRIFCSGPPGTAVDWCCFAARKDIAAPNIEPLKSDVTVRGDGPYRYIEL